MIPTYNISSISNLVCSSPPQTCSRASTELVMYIIGCLEHLKSVGWFGGRKKYQPRGEQHPKSNHSLLPSLAKFSWKNGSPKRLPKVSQPTAPKTNPFWVCHSCHISKLDSEKEASFQSPVGVMNYCKDKHPEKET